MPNVASDPRRSRICPPPSGSIDNLTGIQPAKIQRCRTNVTHDIDGIACKRSAHSQALAQTAQCLEYRQYTWREGEIACAADGLFSALCRALGAN